jgi:hypothetical protein
MTDTAKRAAWITATVWFLYHLTAQTWTPSGEHVFQASAWMHGHWYIEPNIPPEHIIVGGHFYELHPPFPAIVMFLTGLFSYHDEVAVSVVAGAIAAGLVQLLWDDLWLTVFFAVGTNYWFNTINGGPWQFCLVLACMLTFGALLALKHGHPFLTGLLAGFAALSRYDLALVLPVYAYLVWEFYPQPSFISSTHTRS